MSASPCRAARARQDELRGPCSLRPHCALLEPAGRARLPGRRVTPDPVLVIERRQSGPNVIVWIVEPTDFRPFPDRDLEHVELLQQRLLIELGGADIEVIGM